MFKMAIKPLGEIDIPAPDSDAIDSFSNITVFIPYFLFVQPSVKPDIPPSE